MSITSITIGRTYYSDSTGEPRTVMGIVPAEEVPESSRFGARYVGAPEGDRFVWCERAPRTTASYIAETLFRRHYSEKVGGSKHVQLTGETKLCSAWKGNLDQFLTIGDAIDDALFWECLEVVPPACNAPDLMQMGEPTDHGGPDGAARFITFQLHGQTWIYTGIRARNERVEIVGG